MHINIYLLNANRIPDLIALIRTKHKELIFSGFIERNYIFSPFTLFFFILLLSRFHFIPFHSIPFHFIPFHSTKFWIIRILFYIL